MNMRVLFILFAFLLGAHAAEKKGVSFEQNCLSYNLPTAYVDGKPGAPAQCVFALEESDASGSDAESRCETIGPFSDGQKAKPFDSSVASVEQLEKYYAIKQTGYYFAGRQKVIPSSGKKKDALGYLCAIKDRFACERDWFRYGSHCYKTFSVPGTFSDAVFACSDNGGTLPRIHDDEENKFVAMLARKQIFEDKLGKNEIWGPLRYSDGEWANGDASNDVKNVVYMRWWSTEKGIQPVVNNPENYDASTIYTGRNDKDLTAYFGYWGTKKSKEKLPFVCRKPLNQLY